MKTTFFDNRIDGYLRRPLFWDLMFVILIVVLNYTIPIFTFKYLQFSDATNYISNVIGSSVSLAGFILAALTIIVTFKTNIKAKGLEEANNALELILSSKHYPAIVRVFKTSLIELIIIVIVTYCFWLSASNISLKQLNLVLLCSTITMATSIFRSLFILFIALRMDK